MSLGLGQLAGMGILSQFFGGGENNNEQGLLQQNQQQGQNQGFNLNNMTPSQWANTAIALNSMRLEPDPNLATAMRENIASNQKLRQKQQGIERAIKYLSAMPTSKAFPNGRTDLIALVKAELMTPADAIQAAIKVEKPSALTEKYTKLDALALKFGGIDKIPPLQLEILGISPKEITSIQEYNFYKDNLPEGETPLDYFDFLGRGDNEATSIQEYEYYVNTLPKDEKPMSYATFKKGENKPPTSVDEYEYYKNNLPKGEIPMSFSAFLAIDAPKTSVTIEAEQQVKEGNDYWDKYNEVMIPKIIEWQVKSSDTKGNIIKLKEALQALEDPSNLLTGPIIGQMPDFIMAFVNPEAVDTREAVEAVVQRNLKAVLGGQFTEREGEKLIKRAYNPTMPREINAKRLRILIEQMERAALMQDARAEWIRDPANNSSMRGFDGKLPTFADFWTALSANQMGDVVCDSSADNKNRKCYTYQGGDDKLESNWKLVE